MYLGYPGKPASLCFEILYLEILFENLLDTNYTTDGAMTFLAFKLKIFYFLNACESGMCKLPTTELEKAKEPIEAEKACEL